MRLRSALLRPLLVAACVAAWGGCRDQAVDSRWRDRLVTVDGRDPEWESARVYVKDPRIGLGVMNDSTYLYVAVRLGDPTLERQIADGGLTVWIDPRGGRKSTYGVRYPLGALEGLRGPGPATTEGEPAGREDESLRRADARRLEGRFQELLRSAKVQVIGPGPGQLRQVPVASDDPIRVAATFEGGSLVYEARVPLAALGGTAALSRPLGVGFETRRPDSDGFRAMRRRGAGGGRGAAAADGGRGPGGMGRGLDDGLDGGMDSRPEDAPPGTGIMDGGPAGMSDSGPAPLAIWTRVRLAPAAGAAAP